MQQHSVPVENEANRLLGALIVCVVLVIGLYGQTWGPFGGDEPYMAVNLQSDQWSDRLHAYNADFPGISGGQWYLGVQSYERRYIRYLPSLVMWSEWEIFGSDPQPFKRVSLAIHIFTCLLGYLLLYRWLGSVLTATLLTCLIGLHPVVRQPIDWVACQNILVGAACALLALSALVRRHKDEGVVSQLAVVLFAFLALTSSESLIALPALLLAYDVWASRSNAAQGLGQGYRVALLVLYPIYAVLLYVNTSDVTVSDASYRASISEFLSVASTDLSNYIVRSVVGTFSGYSSEVYQRIGQPLLLVGLIVLIGALLFPFRKNPAVWWGLLIYVATLGPGLITRASVSLANFPSTRQLYLPLIGIAILLAGVLPRPLRRVHQIIIVLLCVLSVMVHWNHLPNRERGERHRAMGEVVRAELSERPKVNRIITIGRSRCGYDLRFDASSRPVYDLIPATLRGLRPEIKAAGPRTLLVRSDDGLGILVNPVPPKAGRRVQISPPVLVETGVQSLSVGRVHVEEVTEEGLILEIRYEFDRDLEEMAFFWLSGCADPQRVVLPSFNPV